MSEDIISEYSRQTRVPIYDVGAEHLLKYGTILRYVQETSEQHLGLCGISFEELHEAGQALFIISSRVRIRRRPTHDELITVKTHPRGRAGVQFYRDFKFYDESGALLIDVMQTSVLADTATHKALRPQNLLHFDRFPDPVVPPGERIERTVIREEMELIGERQVYCSDLDSNGHMNNAVYGDIVADFLPTRLRGQEIAEMQITYLSETPLDEVLSIYVLDRGETALMKGVGDGKDRFSASVTAG